VRRSEATSAGAKDDRGSDEICASRSQDLLGKETRERLALRRVEWIRRAETTEALTPIPLRGCIGSGRVTHVWGLDERFDYATSSMPDHATCQRSFRLGAGAVENWQEHLRLPTGPRGRAKLIVFLQIMSSGAKCDGLGCDSVLIRASSDAIDLKAAGVNR
jgi:hypothetical protein